MSCLWMLSRTSSKPPECYVGCALFIAPVFGFAKPKGAMMCQVTPDNKDAMVTSSQLVGSMEILLAYTAFHAMRILSSHVRWCAGYGRQQHGNLVCAWGGASPLP